MKYAKPKSSTFPRCWRWGSYCQRRRVVTYARILERWGA